MRGGEDLSVTTVAVTLHDAIQMGDHGRRTGVLVGVVAGVENYYRLRCPGAGAVVDENQMSRGYPVAGFQRHAASDPGAVQHRAVLAAEVAQSPAVAIP